MNTFRNLCVVFAFSVLTSLNPLSAQSKPKAGEIVSGKVYYDESSMTKAIVMELDSTNQIVAFNYTDDKGRFVFFLVDPIDSIKVAIPGNQGYLPVTVPIDTTYFEIKMEKE